MWVITLCPLASKLNSKQVKEDLILSLVILYLLSQEILCHSDGNFTCKLTAEIKLCTAKENKHNFIKIKPFVHQRTLSKELKDNPQKGRKYLQIFDLYVRDYISRMHKGILQLNNKKPKQPN